MSPTSSLDAATPQTTRGPNRRKKINKNKKERRWIEFRDLSCLHPREDVRIILDGYKRKNNPINWTHNARNEMSATLYLSSFYNSKKPNSSSSPQTTCATTPNKKNHAEDSWKNSPNQTYCRNQNQPGTSHKRDRKEGGKEGREERRHQGGRCFPRCKGSKKTKKMSPPKFAWFSPAGRRTTILAQNPARIKLIVDLWSAFMTLCRQVDLWCKGYTAWGYF
ncbi:hypothetical protein CEXT_255621 [Caerostris extrusa]|uniref:Uncharacterized protein n=1 Tax=Caerostris extrusa TaxID=172846 RepID=A0AAV4N2G7_CAEEX|nr:hypothetical protein CEXT_255621 [Caerostris extrusa]